MGERYELKIEGHNDITDILKELESFGERVINKGNYPSPHYADVYHIDPTTVKAEHNSPSEKGPYYLRLIVYGKPSQEFSKWLQEHKKATSE